MQPMIADRSEAHICTAPAGAHCQTSAVSHKQPFSTVQASTVQTDSYYNSAPAVSLRPLPSTVLPAVGTSDDLSSDMLGVLGAWYAMYCPDREAQLQAAVCSKFDDRASFEDNFLKVTGHQQLNALFYALHRCTDHISIVVEKVEVLSEMNSKSAASADISSDGSAMRLPPEPVYQLCITGRHVFHLPKSIRGHLTSLLLPQAIEAWATDVLTVGGSNSKIVYWRQRVHNLPVLPWLLQWCVGSLFSMLAVHGFGW